MNTEPRPSDPTENIVLPEKKKRVKLRFTSREQIIKRIDKFAIKAIKRREQQRQCYADASQARRLGHSDVENAGKVAKKEAEGDKRGKQADRLEKDVLPKLKAKLAEFDTDPIPGITDDRSVPGI